MSVVPDEGNRTTKHDHVVEFVTVRVAETGATGHAWQAWCSCGWRGGEYAHPSSAHLDGEQHGIREEQAALRELGAQREQGSITRDEVKERVLQYVAEGVSERKVAELTGVARSTVRAWLGKQAHHPQWKPKRTRGKKA